MVAYFHADETFVHAPVQRCYDLLLAIRRYREWCERVRCEPLGPEGVLRVGSRVECSSGPLRCVVEVMRLEPYRRIDLCCITGDVRGRFAWELDPQADGTRVRLLYRGVRPNASAGEPSFAANGWRAHDAALQADVFAGLRRVLEAPGVDVGGGDLFEALHTQRAVRRFRPDPVPDAVLREILAAATRAPSARNAQPWWFVAVRDPALKTAIRGHYLAAWRQAQAFTAGVDADADIKHRPDYPGMMRAVDALAVELDRVPVLVLCCLDTRQLGPMADTDGHLRAPQSAYASIFPAVQNLMLAARGLGVGSTLTTLVLPVEADVRRVVGMPDHLHIAALVPLGYPTRPFRVTTRKPVDRVAFLDRWGNRFPAE